MTIPATQSCPLCGASATRFPDERSVFGRRFFRCPECRLVSVARAELPSRGEEDERYRAHRNDPTDEGYRAYLGRLVDSLVPRLAPGDAGLDYGSGPVPVLAELFGERGFSVAIWDPLFAPDEAPLGRRYDFVTCAETAEHFHRPADELARLSALLAPGGRLALLTQPVPEAFASWYYVRDVTHVSFYDATTFEWIARRHGWKLELPRPDVAVFG